MLERKVSKIYCYFTIKEHGVHPGRTPQGSECELFYYSNAMLASTEEQVYWTKTPVIHSGLPQKISGPVTEKDKLSKKNQKKRKWNSLPTYTCPCGQHPFYPLQKRGITHLK